MKNIIFHTPIGIAQSAIPEQDQKGMMINMKVTDIIFYDFYFFFYQRGILRLVLSSFTRKAFCGITPISSHQMKNAEKWIKSRIIVNQDSCLC